MLPTLGQCRASSRRGVILPALTRAIIVSLFLAFPWSTANGSPPGTTPDKLVRKAIDEIGLLLRTERNVESQNPQRLYAMMDFCEDVMPHIDFRAMARYALGRHWRTATVAQRAQFTRQFRNQLVRIYGAALNKSSDSQIVYLPFSGRPEDDSAVVRTEIKPAGGGPNVSINYSFYKVHSVWKMYDITIDGISLVTTYHHVYVEKVQKEGIGALIANMTRSNNAPFHDEPDLPESTKKAEESATP